MTIRTIRGGRATLVAGLAIIGLFGTAGIANAAPGSTSSFALRTGGLIVAGPFASSACAPGACAPGSLASANVAGLITTGLLETTATTAGASATVNNTSATLSGITTLSATAVSSRCAHDPVTGGVNGSTTIVDGVVNTSLLPPITLASNPAPNTTVTVVDPAVASVVLNRQTTAPDGTLTVDAIFITLLNLQTITIATSICTPTGVPIPIATGNGLLLGGGLLAFAVLVYFLARRSALARQRR
jgi:hypothetical protein